MLSEFFFNKAENQYCLLYQSNENNYTFSTKFKTFCKQSFFMHTQLFARSAKFRMRIFKTLT